ncbi:MAG: diguanylate cyclase [Deltaproteobacteria bacterium]|nr:MAG: diguanylate cyclase [Deltaproteobacteria bacterium]
MEKRNQTVENILSVSRNQRLRELLHDAVGFLGYNSRTTVDGVDVLAQLTTNRFDIVITDIEMLGTDGLELIKRISTDFPEVDVIAITGYQTGYRYTDVVEVGASDFICKPFGVNELAAKIKRIIRERGLRTELRRLTVQDALTGLFNRRHFDQNLKHEAIRALRQKYSLYLLLIDIDNFKQYNDKYGHQMGDTLIRELATIISRNIREDVDSGYRYGGDEFAIMIPHANRQQARLVANRLLTIYNEKNLTPTGLSLGLAKLEGSHETLETNLEDLVRKADSCLYLAKSNGGNQVREDGGTKVARNTPIGQHSVH